MKTPEEEIKSRRLMLESLQKKYNDLYQKTRELKEKGRQEDTDYTADIQIILDSEEMRSLEYELTHGPIYDIYKEDLEDPGYKDLYGVHPLELNDIRRLWEDEIYGKHVYFPDLNISGTIECLANDYYQYYFKLLMPDTTEYIKITTEYESD